MTTNNDLEPAAARSADMIPILRRTGLIVVFLWFAFGGVAHFALTEAEMSIVPRWVLIVRLPFQMVLLALILWSTASRPGNPSQR